MEAWVAQVERSGEGEVERGGVVREKGEAEKGRKSKEGEGLGYGVPARGAKVATSVVAAGGWLGGGCWVGERRGSGRESRDREGLGERRGNGVAQGRRG